MLNENFVFVGVLFNIIGGIGYLVGTLKGTTKPNRVTWLLWALAPLIAFSAQINQGVGIRALLTFMVGFNPLLIFLASFVNRNAHWKITRFDMVCGILSVLGLILWSLTSNPNLAIALSITADGLASLPTVVKAYKFPETETSTVFFGGAISAFVTLLTIKTWSFAYYGFPVYILLICVVLASLIQFKLGKRLSSAHESI